MVADLCGPRGQFSMSGHENVIPSLQQSPPWVDGVYFNIRPTATAGTFALMHDATVDRTTNGTGAIASMTLPQIKALDAGDGAEVPTLTEYLDAIVEMDQLEGRRELRRLFLNPRGTSFAQVEQIYNTAMDYPSLIPRYIWVSSFPGDLDIVQNIRQISPDAPIALFLGTLENIHTIIDSATQLGAVLIFVNPGSTAYSADPTIVQTVQNAGFMAGVSRTESLAVAQAVHQDPFVDVFFTPRTDELSWWHPDAQDEFVNETIRRALGGSHQAVSEARVLVSYQTGDDPDGEDVPIIVGDVAYDGTADVYATVSLTVPGVSRLNGQSMFPRHAWDRYAPYGNELFIRRGIDLGGNGVLWVPLGVFRIDSVEQSEAPKGALTITGSDRMAGIIDARLITPMVFESNTTVMRAVSLLVREVYPQAVIHFDDQSASSMLGRQLVIEESRYDALRDIADSLGKNLYWDGQGVLRFETPAEMDAIQWEINAGRDGVLIAPARRVSRERVYNAVVATGEGASESPVHAVAYDDGVNSPTRFGGRFGRVPRFYSSPFLYTQAQAQNAARSMLRRSIGVPYSVNFGTVVNPAMRPHHVARITQSDYNRENHIIETYNIPLAATDPALGTTKEQTMARIGLLP